jgi:DNA-binding MurR/RpiR family transcriptional regulator
MFIRNPSIVDGVEYSLHSIPIGVFTPLLKPYLHRARLETNRVSPVAQRPTPLSASLTLVKSSPAEGRVVQVLTDDPQFVAFRTMAELMERADVGAGTIARLCVKLNLSGFAELQRRAQDELAGSLRPAAVRIKERPATDLVGQVAQAEVSNVANTFDRVNRSTFDSVVALLADAQRHVIVLASDACRGIGLQYANELSFLRANVELLDGNPVTVGRRLALGDATDIVVAIDIRRYDNWLVETVKRFANKQAVVISLTDSAASPIAMVSAHYFTIDAESPGPFDSFTAALALLNAVNAATAGTLRKSATDRLEKVEQAWRTTKVIAP